MKTNSTAYQSYLLRLWCEKDGADWRAALENVATHESRNFPNLMSLFEFLHDQTGQMTASIPLDELIAQPTRETHTPIYIEYFEEEVND
jgi:translation initiation factor 2 alpha subunit (eIF-2alpha)